MLSKTQLVTINDVNSREELTCVTGYGTFTIYVEDNEHPDSGASAIFNIASNKSTTSIHRPCNTPGIDGESLTLIWTPGERPKLGYNGKPNPEFLPKSYSVVCLSLGSQTKH